ncbi:MAG: hypothetical protein SGJ10_10635 [Bacteroidota bacterium]|nr:hypothetical protein [Bacteroidota bacterium]
MWSITFRDYYNLICRKKNIITTGTAKKTKHFDELHFEHKLWSSEFKFYNDELKIYQSRLEKISAKNTSTEVRSQIEHFQNQFIIQKEHLDILNDEINKHEQWLTKYAQEHPVAINHQVFADHDDINERAASFTKIYKELKTEFMKFLAVWM